MQMLSTPRGLGESRFQPYRTLFIHGMDQQPFEGIFLHCHETAYLFGRVRFGLWLGSCRGLSMGQVPQYAWIERSFHSKTWRKRFVGRRSEITILVERERGAKTTALTHKIAIRTLIGAQTYVEKENPLLDTGLVHAVFHFLRESAMQGKQTPQRVRFLPSKETCSSSGSPKTAQGSFATPYR